MTADLIQTRDRLAMEPWRARLNLITRGVARSLLRTPNRRRRYAKASELIRSGTLDVSRAFHGFLGHTDSFNRLIFSRPK